MTEIKTEEILLERLKFTAAQHLSSALLESAQIEQVAELVWGDLVYRLQVNVMADKILTDEAEVGFVRHVPLPYGWRERLRWLFKPPEKVPVSGTVKVKAEYFRTFPESEIAYPSALGNPVRLMKLSAE